MMQRYRVEAIMNGVRLFQKWCHNMEPCAQVCTLAVLAEIIIWYDAIITTSDKPMDVCNSSMWITRSVG